MFWFYIISAFGLVASYLIGVGRGTREEKRRWHKEAVEAGFAKWQVTSSGDVQFWWENLYLVCQQKFGDQKSAQPSPPGNTSAPPR